jgi:hypothetical protein
VYPFTEEYMSLTPYHHSQCPLTLSWNHTLTHPLIFTCACHVQSKSYSTIAYVAFTYVNGGTGTCVSMVHASVCVVACACVDENERFMVSEKLMSASIGMPTVAETPPWRERPEVTDQEQVLVV